MNQAAHEFAIGDHVLYTAGLAYGSPARAVVVRGFYFDGYSLFDAQGGTAGDGLAMYVGPEGIVADTPANRAAAAAELTRLTAAAVAGRGPRRERMAALQDELALLERDESLDPDSATK
jgi:hypothetical protein